MLSFTFNVAEVFPLQARKELFTAALQTQNTTSASVDILYKSNSFYCHYNSRHSTSIDFPLHHNKAKYDDFFSDILNVDNKLHNLIKDGNGIQLPAIPYH